MLSLQAAGCHWFLLSWFQFLEKKQGSLSLPSQCGLCLLLNYLHPLTINFTSSSEMACL
jgi:hypothetical protein